MQDNTVEILDHFIEEIRREHATGAAREHSYRPALKGLFESLNPGIIAVNEPARTDIGAPDFQIEKQMEHQLRQVQLLSSPPLAFVEAKDLTENLDKPEHQEQLKRYFKLGNILHTNCLTFRFYLEGQLNTEIELAQLMPDGKIIVDSAQYHSLALAFNKLLQTTSLTVRTPSQLAKLMAERAQAIRDIIEAALTSDISSNSDSELKRQFRVFQTQLVHDLDEHKFADLYAQTLAYGLFAARYNDQTLKDFSLKEAAQILPPTNQFLRKFFREIAGYESENRINWVLDNLVEVFNRVNVRQLMRGAGEEWAKHHDPIIHFYETFLGLYDAKLRKSMGVYYTPQPVVKYMVRAVDQILKDDFGIAAGLSDTSKIEAEFKSHPNTAAEKRQGYAISKKQVHRVQVLDPALGTGTFLNETIKYIAAQTKPAQGSMWSKYVEDHLLPRLYGFELMMAPYAMANLRLNLTLAETGYKPIKPDAKLQVLLTNSLEAPHTEDLNQMVFAGFQQILANEAQEADIVKANHRIMVVMGNPPYSVSSNNKSAFIENLVKDYKTDLKERNIQPLSDDYIKFIRFAEDMIAKNGEGIVAMITNNSYIDGTIHRQMRNHLMATFNEIYILDLHGSTKKGEVSPDGQADVNVFDIQQGVSINVFVKKRNDTAIARIHHAELYGSRQAKFDSLSQPLMWQEIHPDAANNFFTPVRRDLLNNYNMLSPLNELFVTHNAGTATGNDSTLVGMSAQELTHKLEAAMLPFSAETLCSYRYRPFDTRYTVYDSKIIQRLRVNVMQHLYGRDNVALLVTQKNRQLSDLYVSLTNQIVDRHLLDSAGDSMHVFPLYVYHEDGSRTVNFNPKVLKEFTANLTNPFEPEEILDYIYAVLHSSKYREKYKEFLKIDFPRVPRSENESEFRRLAELGKQLRLIHLLQSPELDKYHFTPSGDGDWIIDKLRYEPIDESTGRVYVNDSQYFDSVPPAAYDYYIGGYQPAQKWLKDRRGRTLTPEDANHYQKIIAALIITAKIQQSIDMEPYEANK